MVLVWSDSPCPLARNDHAGHHVSAARLHKSTRNGGEAPRAECWVQEFGPFTQWPNREPRSVEGDIRATHWRRLLSSAKNLFEHARLTWGQERGGPCL